jgi:hypothetical protein
MKKFSATVQYVTLTTNGALVGIDQTPVTGYCEDRNDAIRKASDVGQAISRSTNNTDLKIFYRIVGLEIGA